MQDGRGSGHARRHVHGLRRLRLRLPEGRERRAPAGAHLALRRAAPPAHRVRERLGVARDRRRRSRSRSTRRTCASTPTARAARAASTSTRPTRRCASRTFRPASWCSARTSARSTRTASSAMKVLRARLYERARRGAGGEARGAARARRRRSASAARSAPTRCTRQQRVKDHRTELEVGNAEGVLDGDLDRFIRASLLQRARASQRRNARERAASARRARERLERAARGRASIRSRRASGRCVRLAELRARTTRRRRGARGRGRERVAVAGRVLALRSFGKLRLRDARRGRRAAPGERPQAGAVARGLLRAR